jgi:hypothetical protein
MKRKFHRYEKWEDFKHGLWRKIKDKKEEEGLLEEAIKFTGNYSLYGEYMRRVTAEWFFSCQHNLTDTNLNRRAWIGHAACCLAIGCPEYITRRAWGMLSQEQRDLADNEADIAIKKWEEKQPRQLSLF